MQPKGDRDSIGSGMTTKTNDQPDQDVAALRTAIGTADQLIAHYQQGIGIATDLKRTLVFRLLRTQYPRLSVDEQEKLLRSYGLDSGHKT